MGGIKKDLQTDLPEDINKIVQIISALDVKKGVKISKPLFYSLIGSVIVSIIVVTLCSIFFITTLYDMQKFYNKSTEEIIITKSDIDLANSWERLPVNQRKERLREQYYQIIRYYTNNIPAEQKMTDDQILDSFNVLWNCIQRVPSINFFLPVAYIKAKTNFNPSYNVDHNRGLAGFYLHQAEQICNLELIQNDIIFKTVYRGLQTVNNPSETIKLLIAEIDRLSKFFNDREDWIILALYEGQDKVVKDWWDNGEGSIPDIYYREGLVAETLMYYQSFKNWQIPAMVQ